MEWGQRHNCVERDCMDWGGSDGLIWSWNLSSWNKFSLRHGDKEISFNIVHKPLLDIFRINFKRGWGNSIQRCDKRINCERNLCTNIQFTTLRLLNEIENLKHLISKWVGHSFHRCMDWVHVLAGHDLYHRVTKFDLWREVDLDIRACLDLVRKR